jgi:hypothetical protein
MASMKRRLSYGDSHGVVADRTSVWPWHSCARGGALAFYKRSSPPWSKEGQRGRLATGSGRAACRQRGKTGYARVRARHVARRLPWRSGRVRSRDARPRGAEPWEGARPASGRHACGPGCQGGGTTRTARRVCAQCAGAQAASRSACMCQIGTV